MTGPSLEEIENRKVGREYEAFFGMKYPGGTIGHPATKLSLAEQVADMRHCMEVGIPRDGRVNYRPGCCY